MPMKTTVHICGKGRGEATEEIVKHMPHTRCIRQTRSNCKRHVPCNYCEFSLPRGHEVHARGMRHELSRCVHHTKASCEAHAALYADVQAILTIVWGSPSFALP